MDEGPRFFTVEEANALVSTLQIEFGRIAQVRSLLGPLIQALGGPDDAVAVLQEDAPLPAGLEEQAAELRDFYAIVDGEPAFLCWQFGEPAISHWHPLDEGYAARKPIEGADVPEPQFLN